PLEPRIPGRLATRSRKIELAAVPLLADLPRLERKLTALPANVASERPLVLISRRQLLTNNSWMHNSPRLVKGRDRCTLLMHPDDARGRSLATGDRATVASRVGAIEAPVEVSDEMMPGVVCIPHGWGHARAGDSLGVASAHPGVSINDVTDERLFDA